MVQNPARSTATATPARRPPTELGRWAGRRVSPLVIRAACSSAHWSANPAGQSKVSGEAAAAPDHIGRVQPPPLRPTLLVCRRFFYWKWNMSKRSPIAGILAGTYGLKGLAIGFGRLSRLRLVSGFRLQFRSMNFKIEAWS